MERMVIEGGHRLEGRVRVSGAKNAVLPLMAATLLCEDACVIENVPDLRDVRTMMKILEQLGKRCVLSDGVLQVEHVDECSYTAPYDLVRTMRASVCVLGPLLAKRGIAEVSLPGGCVIGPRPIDLHLKGLGMLGASLEIRGGYIEGRAKRLKGTDVFLGGSAGPSVLATANVMMAAVLAEGTTVIEFAAMEPEIVDLAHFLNEMGANVRGAGGHRIVVDGVRRLHGVSYGVIGDRIEAGTFMCAVGAAGGEVVLEGVEWEHLLAVVDALRRAGLDVERCGNGVSVAMDERPRAVDAVTHPYPGFPTDMQAQLMALLSIADGTSIITETVFPERFIHVGELNRMGGCIVRDGPTAVVTGVERLSGAPVMASDLRASAALVVAGLAAEGTTSIGRVYHLDRGYEALDAKLGSLGAVVRREEDAAVS